MTWHSRRGFVRFPGRLHQSCGYPEPSVMSSFIFPFPCLFHWSFISPLVSSAAYLHIHHSLLLSPSLLFPPLHVDTHIIQASVSPLPHYLPLLSLISFLPLSLCRFVRYGRGTAGACGHTSPAGGRGERRGRASGLQGRNGGEEAGPVVVSGHGAVSHSGRPAEAKKPLLLGERGGCCCRSRCCCCRS